MMKTTVSCRARSTPQETTDLDAEPSKSEGHDRRAAMLPDDAASQAGDSMMAGDLPAIANPARRPLWRRVARVLGATLLVYVLVAYVFAPLAWVGYAKRHPWFDAMPTVTRTKDDHPGDPLNVALVGREVELKRIMQDAGWYPADPLGLRSDLRIAADTVLERPYDEAPVSSLYLFGRKEDLAFEQPVGPDPRQRHHVRFWRTDKADDSGRPMWLGSATFDRKVGFSHTTGQITHHIAPDLDAERDHLFKDLEKTEALSPVQVIDDFQKVHEGRNGGGDPWYTDGNLFLATIEFPGDPPPVAD